MKTIQDVERVKLIRSLTNLHSDLARMEEDEDYNIFDDWEVGELQNLVEKLIDRLTGETT